MRVRHHAQDVAARLLVEGLIRGDAARHVVAERDKIDGRFQRLAVGIRDLKLNTVVAEKALHIARVGATALHVAKELPRAVFLQRLQYIFRLAGQRIHQAAQQHVTDSGIRDNLVAGLHGQRAGHQLVMDRLIHLPFTAGFRQAHAGHRRVQGHIDLVEGQPELYLLLVARKHGTGVALEEPNGLAAAPPAVLLHQSPRHFVMRQRHQRGDVVRCQLVKQPVVKRQPRFVRLLLVAVRKNAGPGNGDAQAAKAHLSEQFDVFRVAVIEVDGDVLDAAVARHALNHRAEDTLRLNV